MQQKVIALGFFDGVHIGHGALLRKTVQRAQEGSFVPVAFTFDRAPREAVFGTPVPLINSSADRALLMQRLYGVEEVIIAPFDRDMMTMGWEAFVEMLLRDHGAVHLVAGHDFRFGHKNEGDAEKLRQKCLALGIGCDIVEEVKLEGITVSSTHIRSLLEQGDIEQANRFLGHPHLLSRTVTEGLHLGRTIGIPTINFSAPETLILPKDGVYVSTVTLPDGQTLLGVTNVGCRPTVGGKHRTVETFLLDFSGDLYGVELQLAFRARLRDEAKFSSLDALRQQIEIDISMARECFSHGVSPF